jgi:hypothetical protein
VHRRASGGILGAMRDGSRRPLYITLAILAVGWAIGIPIYLARSAEEESLPFELTEDGKKYIYNLERLGGRSAVFYEQLGDALSSAFHGWRLGITICLISCVVALIYFIRATRKLS